MRLIGDGEAATGKVCSISSVRLIVVRDHRYDYEDNFIDDSEFVEYYAGDRRKAKHTGFFVNTGEIEKVTFARHFDLDASLATCRECIGNEA